MQYWGLSWISSMLVNVSKSQPADANAAHANYGLTVLFLVEAGEGVVDAEGGNIGQLA